MGVRKAASMVTLTLAATTYTLHTLSTGRTGIVRKIRWHQASGGDGYLQIGTGAFTQRLPNIRMVNAQPDGLMEAEIPAFEFEVDIVAQSTVAGAIVTIEVEEI